MQIGGCRRPERDLKSMGACMWAVHPLALCLRDSLQLAASPRPTTFPMPDEPLPKFDSPPVIETVLGVQFTPLANFTGALAGSFWKSRLVVRVNELMVFFCRRESSLGEPSSSSWARAFSGVNCQSALPSRFRKWSSQIATAPPNLDDSRD